MSDPNDGTVIDDQSLAAARPDLDEYGAPVRDEYRRLGASGDEEGMFVRFEPGFGLNVHVGYRYKAGPHAANPGSFIETEFPLGIDGWERLCELADEWRARRAECAAAVRRATEATRKPELGPPPITRGAVT